MTKLKLGALSDDKPVKLTLKCPLRSTVTLSPMQRCWNTKLAKRLTIRQN